MLQLQHDDHQTKLRVSTSIRCAPWGWFLLGTWFCMDCQKNSYKTSENGTMAIKAIDIFSFPSTPWECYSVILGIEIFRPYIEGVLHTLDSSLDTTLPHRNGKLKLVPGALSRSVKLVCGSGQFVLLIGICWSCHNQKCNSDY